MILLQGNDNSYWKLFHRDSSEEETRFNAGCFIRWLFTKCITFTPSYVLKLLNSHMNEPQDADIVSGGDNINMSQDIKDVARILAQSENKIDENNKVNASVNSQNSPSLQKNLSKETQRKSEK